MKMRTQKLFDVQKYGVSIQYTEKVSEADSAFKLANPGGVVFYEIDHSTGNKYVVKSK